MSAKRRKGKMEAATAKIINFSNGLKKKSEKYSNKKAIKFSEMSKKDQKESMDALRDD